MLNVLLRLTRNYMCNSYTISADTERRAGLLATAELLVMSPKLALSASSLVSLLFCAVIFLFALDLVV